MAAMRPLRMAISISVPSNRFACLIITSYRVVIISPDVHWPPHRKRRPRVDWAYCPARAANLADSDREQRTQQHRAENGATGNGFIPEIKQQRPGQRSQADGNRGGNGG